MEQDVGIVKNIKLLDLLSNKETVEGAYQEFIAHSFTQYLDELYEFV